MKKYLFIHTFTFVVVSQLLAAEFSTITNNLFIGLEGWRQQSGMMVGDSIRFDDELVWRPFCLTGQVDLFYPNPLHGIKIKLWGANGKEIPKTKLGQTYGSKWNKLHNYMDGYRERIGRITADQVPYIPSGDFTGAELPRICDLFKIDEAGTYTLEIQMQMFRNPGSSDTNQWQRSLFGFSPMRIKVEKP